MLIKELLLTPVSSMPIPVFSMLVSIVEANFLSVLFIDVAENPLLKPNNTTGIHLSRSIWITQKILYKQFFILNCDSDNVFYNQDVKRILPQKQSCQVGTQINDTEKGIFIDLLYWVHLWVTKSVLSGFYQERKNLRNMQKPWKHQLGAVWTIQYERQTHASLHDSPSHTTLSVTQVMWDQKQFSQIPPLSHLNLNEIWGLSVIITHFSPFEKIQSIGPTL